MPSTKFGQLIAALLCCCCYFCCCSPETEYRCVKLNSQKLCHSSDPDPYRFYATVTTYAQQRAHSPIPEKDIPQDCKPLFFNLISRHTTRYPDEARIDRMRDDLPNLQRRIVEADMQGKTQLCEDDMRRLRNFEWNITNDEDAMLAAGVGEMSAQQLGELYKKRFPEIFNLTFDESRLEVEHTDQERTIKTAEYLVKGLFGETIGDEVKGHIKNDDLYFSFICDKYQKKCDYFLHDDVQILKFQNGPTMKALLDSVSERLGTKVSLDDMFAIYDACRFGYALEDGDVWCSLLSKEELLVLEYEEDLRYYWKDGYGNNISIPNACPIAKSLTKQFKQAAYGKGYDAPKVLIQATHAEELKNVYSMLGLFKNDEPLRADNMCNQTDRIWRTSLMTPFLSHLAFVVYRCGPGGQHKVLTLQNERPVTIMGCKGPLCDLNDFLKTYKPFDVDCNVKRLCCKCC